MKNNIGRKIIFVVIFVFLGHFQVANAESNTISENLPLDVQVDLLMTELSTLLKVDDNQGIINLIPRIRSLDIEIPDSLSFLEARALYRTGQALAARDRLVVYLANTGRKGRYYDQATELLLSVKEEAEVQEKRRREQERMRQEELARSAEKARTLRIREAQTHLQQLGFRNAVVNGEFSKATREAVAVYQIRRDLDVNGRVTDETLESLKAEVPEKHNCDALARYARGNEEWSIPIKDIASQAAIPACNEALRLNPDVIRFQIQYTRALLSAGRYGDAMNAIQLAARLGYPAGQYVMGETYERGKGVKRNKETARSWYRRAGNQGHTPSAIKLKKLGG